jgi:hypothetical protein
MEAFVWGLFLMIQNPERCTTPNMPEAGCETIASLNVTYSEKGQCTSTARKLTEMHTSEKTVGVYVRVNVAYVCVLQPRPAAQ